MDTATEYDEDTAAANDDIDRQDRSEKLDNGWLRRQAVQIMPAPVTALLWAGAEAASAIPEGALLGPAAYLAVAVAWWSAWARRNPINRAARRRWAAAVAGAGGVWMTWATLAGPTGGVLDVLLVGAVIAAVPHWRRNTIPIPSDPRAEAPMPDIPDDTPTLETATIEVASAETPFVVDRWDGIIAAPGGPVAGSYLTVEGPHPAPGVERYTIQMRAGVHTTSTAMAATALVASALGLGMDSVSITPHLSGDQSKAVLTVAIKNPLATTIWYPGPLAALDMTAGVRAWIGQRANGEAVWWQFYRRDWGACGGFICGGTRSGKSELLGSIMASAAYSRVVRVFPACPQGGASFPHWVRHGHWPGATKHDEILRQAQALDRALTARSKINSLRGENLWVPTEQEPILLWVLDECHQELKRGSEMAEIANNLARQGAKVGIAPIFASQYTDLPVFGGEESTRSSVLAGNLVALRVATRGVKNMLPGLDADPSALPQVFPDGSPTSGLGYTGGTCTDPFRAGRVRGMAELAANAPDLPIEKVTAAFMGDDYLNRHGRGMEQRAALAAEMQQHDPELVAAIVENDPALAEALRNHHARPKTALRPTASPTAEQPKRAGWLTIAPGPVLLIPDTTPELRPAPVKPQTCVDVVRALFDEGVTDKADFVTRAVKPDGEPYGETQVRNAINQLIDDGFAHRTSHGRYEREAA